MEGKWAISFDEENYSGGCEASKEAAIDSGHEAGRYPFWVGQVEAPTPPEQLWDAVDWIEHVRCQDDYSCDWADGAIPANKAQIEELEAEIRPILAAWLDRHGLRPRHFCIDPVSVVKIERADDDPDAIGGPGYGGNAYPDEI